MKTEEHPEEVRDAFIREMVKSEIKMLGYPNRHHWAAVAQEVEDLRFNPRLLQSACRRGKLLNPKLLPSCHRYMCAYE